MNQEDLYWTEKEMKQFGGGFVKALAEAMSQADPFNIQRIQDAFPEYMSQYFQMGQKLKEVHDRKSN